MDKKKFLHIDLEYENVIALKVYLDMKVEGIKEEIKESEMLAKKKNKEGFKKHPFSAEFAKIRAQDLKMLEAVQEAIDKARTAANMTD